MHPTDDRHSVLDRLIRDEYPGLERLLRTMVPASDVPDLVQATFEAFLGARDRVRTSERALLRGIATMMVRKHWEKHYRRSTAPFDSSVHSVFDVGASLSSALDRRHRVIDALRALPADQHLAIVQVECEGYSIRETAEALNVAEKTVEGYLTRARAKLRQTLGAEATRWTEVYRAD